ncbi:three-helix bundle dimerization domain-containing protein [Nocardia goodfellowii]|uniref:Protein-tyrosine-phosphatase-like N-terminal domain-containing protein n=1 Tax=Nocardia goodfellowii TaxID=882446 RepID=A0ABS4QLT0_9NOCA|nr:hypothetical protein [Nocardia goodfellowii]MBP2192657.1 hypothetical protein [Nocardia goodfellowii]
MTESPATGTRTHDPALDQETALRFAVNRLEEEFAGLADEAAIEGMLRAAYDRLAADATLEQFLPLLAERYTRELLRAAAAEQSTSAGH